MTRRAAPARRGMRGAALLLVLWLVMLLVAIVGAFALNARTEYLQGRVASQGVVAEAAARAGLEYAVVRVDDTDPQWQWVPDGRNYDWRFGDADVRIAIVDESGKIDLNEADATLLTGLFRAVGESQDVAARMASAIVDWRDDDTLSQAQGGAEDAQYAAAGLPYGAKDAPFDTVAEVEQVMGMTPALYAKVARHLTVYTGSAQPDQNYASMEVLQAMGVDPAPILAQRNLPQGAAGTAPAFMAGSGTYSIDSRARLRDGREAVLRAVVRTGASGVPGSAYTPLRWDEGASAQ